MKAIHRKIAVIVLADMGGYVNGAVWSHPNHWSAAGIVLWLAGAGLIVAAWNLYRQPPPDGHVHAWGMWEDCDLTQYHRKDGTTVKDVAPGQRRDCIGCGEREVRRVSAP